MANSDHRPVSTFVTSKTSLKITATLDRALAELREAGRRRHELVSAYFGCCADLQCALDKVERVRRAGQQQLAKVAAGVEEKVRAAQADCEPVRASVAQALVAAADSLTDPVAAELLGVSVQQIRSARKHTAAAAPLPEPKSARRPARRPDDPVAVPAGCDNPRP